MMALFGAFVATVRILLRELSHAETEQGEGICRWLKMRRTRTI